MLIRFNHHCLLCGNHCVAPHYFCISCYQDLPIIGACCSVCGRGLMNTSNATCGVCTQKTPLYHTTIVPFYYQEPISTLITSLKFNNQLGIATVLANLMSPTLHNYYRQHPKPQLIIPTPLHTQRLSTRGFNQVILLAKRLQCSTGIPLDHHSVTRIRNTPSQHLLPQKTRRRNLHGAFDCSFETPVKHVALVDDVITTGTTINTLCATLIQQGVTTIDIWACARTQTSL